MSPWLLRLRRSARPRRRLVCFPHAGGGANFFRGWGDVLDPAWDLLVAQYPGRENRLAEPLVHDVSVVVTELVAALAAEETDECETILFGHSMGALLAYEVARACQTRNGPRLRHLFVSGREGPTAVADTTSMPRSDEDILALVRRHGATPEAVLAEPSLRAMVLDVLRNDYLLVDSYRPSPGPRLSVDITAVGGDEDPHVPVDRLRAWRHSTTGRFSWRTFPGGHFYLTEHRDAIIKAIEHQLRAVT